MKEARKKEAFEKAKKAIIEHKLIFIEDIIAMIAIAKSTFYDYFPLDSNESNDLRQMLDENRINTKVKMRAKWEESESAALQMGLYKLLSTEEELKRLAMVYNDHTTGGDKLSFKFDMPTKEE